MQKLLVGDIEAVWGVPRGVEQDVRRAVGLDEPGEELRGDDAEDEPAEDEPKA